MISIARTKDDRRIVSELRARGEEGNKDSYKFLRGENNRQMNVVDELIANGVSVKDIFLFFLFFFFTYSVPPSGKYMVTMVNAITEFWEDIGGMNETTNEVNGMPELCVERKTVDGMLVEISCVKIEENLKKVKNGKAAGLDDMPYDFYKNGGRCVTEKLYALFKEIWVNERVPD